MKLHEILCAQALEAVTFPPATPQKRFAREMLALSRSEATTGQPVDLTPAQSLWLSALVYRYRRQIANHYLVAACAIRTHAGEYDRPWPEGPINCRCSLPEPRGVSPLPAPSAPPFPKCAWCDVRLPGPLRVGDSCSTCRELLAMGLPGLPPAHGMQP